MEDNNTYTYEPKNEEKKPVNVLKIGFIVAVALFASLAIMVGIVMGNRNAQKDAEEQNTTAAAVPVVTEVPTTSAPTAKYAPGKYKVDTGSVALKFRKEHNKDAETILEIADQTELEIIEIYFDQAAVSEDYSYWGKAEYKGHTGWLSMKYLSKVLASVVTPEQITTLPVESTTTVPETTTLPVAESTTVPTTAPTTQAPETTTEPVPETTKPSTGGYTAGDYAVSVDGSTLTLRKGPGTGNESILSIPDGTTLTVTEVVDNASSDSALRYWGKVTYKGYTGYVCMKYLKK